MSDVLKDRGSATVFVVTSLALVLFAGIAVAAMSGLVVAHRHAQSAADLAALAGAAAIGTSAAPCAAAGRVAAANGAAVESCRSTPKDITLVVSVAGPELTGHLITLRAVARAGR